MNVTMYGDSILKGILLENGRYTINREWEEKLSGLSGLNIRNRSRFGCTIQKALTLIRKDSIKTYGAGEYAILEFGGNDCDYRWDEIAAAPELEHDCKTPPALFEERYREVIRLIRASGRTPVMMTLPPIHSERYLQFICRDGLPREKILAWLGDVERIYRWQSQYSDIVATIAQQEQVKLIDLRGAFLRDGRPAEELLCADGIHPSRSGQSVIYRTVRDWVA